MSKDNLQCLAERYHGDPIYEGSHPSHFFTYGQNGINTGHCAGRTTYPPPFDSPYYKKCEDPNCKYNFAYTAPFPEAVHYHYIGDKK